MAQEEAAALMYFGQSIGAWIQTGAIVLSAFYAGRQVRMLREQTSTHEQQARRRATVDMVVHEQQDPTLRAARQKYAALRDKFGSLTQFACQPQSEHPEENEAILAVLNSYEFMAIGIREGAFDEGIYKRMKKSLIVRDWENLSGYALEMRKKLKRERLFIEFEKLAKQWDEEDRVFNLPSY